MTVPPKKEGSSRPLSPEACQERAAVSRKTLDRFHLYAALLTKWNLAINLVSAASMADLWRRHFLDSAQLRCFLPAAQAGDGLIILDVGTGAGFPGRVLAPLGCGEVHLVEADRRQDEFLREAVRGTGANDQVHHARIAALAAFP